MLFESSEEQNSDRDGEGGTSHGSVGTQPKLGITEQGVWQLAWPTMAAMGAGTVVRFTDFVMVRDLGPSALAAVGVGGQFYWFIESLGAIAPGGLAAILARAVGAGDRSLADASFRQAHLLGRRTRCARMRDVIFRLRASRSDSMALNQTWWISAQNIFGGGFGGRFRSQWP